MGLSILIRGMRGGGGVIWWYGGGVMNGKDEFGLVPKQRKFAELYLNGMYATHALKAAGYRSRDTAKAAWLMLQRPGMRAYVKAQRERMAEINGIEREELVAWLWRVVRTPISEVGENSDLLEGEMIRNYQNGTTVKQVRMVSKLGAAKQLAKMLGWNEPEKHEVEVKTPGQVMGEMIERIRARNAGRSDE